MPFFETHCHLDFDFFEGRVTHLLQACERAGIESLVVPSVARRNWSTCLALSDAYKQVHCALGLHPYFMREHNEQDLSELEHLLRTQRERIVALGETGLDDTCELFDRQCDFFEAHLKLAEIFELPVIMHMRRNHGQGLKRVKKFNLVGGVVHAFSGSLEDARAWIDQGMMIGVGGVITFDRAEKTRNTIAQVPLESLVLETDSPDMFVQGEKKGQGSPLMLRKVFDALCRLRKESAEEIETTLWHNSKRLFCL